MTQRRVGKQNRIAVYTAQYREMIILTVFQIHDDGDFQLRELLERQGIAFRFKTQIWHNAPHILKRRAHLLLIQLFQHFFFRQRLPVKIVQKRRHRSRPAGKIQILLYNIEIAPFFPTLHFDFSISNRIIVD
ncbi:Uncharacterised protein [Neisseria meningitidis]|nr:Uncharacterised protein [Neisseria meningitidis]CWQ35543.1 Uncharacterised protein [Neisseria meningitidis]CWU04532.1 Uncharacterised protein [Neisseria meningitidis]